VKPVLSVNRSHRADNTLAVLREHLLKARTPVPRSVETMVGAVELARPYFYCRLCGCDLSPLDDVLGLRAGRLQRDVQQAAAQLVTEVPYAMAAALFGDLKSPWPENSMLIEQIISHGQHGTGI
jgi:hypothetical protein